MTNKIPKASVAPGLAPDEWLQPLFSQSIAAYVDARPVQDPAQAKTLPEIHQYHLGQALFMDSKFEAQRFRRDMAMMARNDDTDHLSLQYFVRGRNRVINGNTEYIEQPGNIFAVNLAYQVEAQSEESEVLLLVLPRELVRREIPQLTDAMGGIFMPHSASAQIFCHHMMALKHSLSRATSEEIAAIIQGTLGLLGALVQGGDITASAAQQATLRTMCSFIDKHLRDPQLSVETLCRQFRCSRATLYRLFKPLGGVREHIQRRRLMACFKAISIQGHRRIFDIALEYGFVSPSHFSNLFRDYFGLTPREAREAGNQPPQMVTRVELVEAPVGKTALENAELMWQWGRTLAKTGGLLPDEI